MRRRGLAFAVLAAVCGLAATGFVALAAMRGGGDETPSGGGMKLTTGIAFKSVGDTERTDGKLAVLGTGGKKTLSKLDCSRLYFAGGRGICVAADGTGARYRALIIDDHLKVLRAVPLDGLPSRARVSADGRYGATTNFVTGHSYTFGGGFSTETVVIDMATGKRLFNLEQLTLYDEQGKRIDRPDINLWGVTFDAHDSNRFYATLRANGGTHLMRGDIAKRSAAAIKTNVECPSLSPDGTRIAYKRVVGAKQDRWHLYVLDLKTMKDTPLAEDQQVDDQVEWLDEHTVLYERDYDVYEVPADGTGAPKRLIQGAESPSVLR
jgi:hypothetical protein